MADLGSGPGVNVRRGVLLLWAQSLYRGTG